MKLLSWPRQSGKTRYLINKAKDECVPVLVFSKYWAGILKEKYLYPYIYYNPEQELHGSNLSRKFRASSWFVDEIDLCDIPLWMDVVLATTTDPDIAREVYEFNIREKI